MRASEYCRSISASIEPDGQALKKAREWIDDLKSRPKKISIWRLQQEVGEVMSHLVGIFRSQERLQIAREKIQSLCQQFDLVGLQDKGMVFNTELTAALELHAVLDLAQVIAKSALFREESRGAHHRLDFPKRDDERWLKHTMAYYSESGPRLDALPVTITRYPPQERKY